MTVLTVVLLVVVGIVAGSVAATLGIGGGVIYVPALVAIFGLSQHAAEGTSLALIVPTAIIATIVHARAGRVDWRVAALLAAGATIGGFLGAHTALALDEALLRRLFGILVGLTAIRMLRKTRRSAHPEE